jgi:tetratricopeptide (TPR) repeat protein
MKKILRATVLVLSLSFILISAAQAQSPQQTLNQYVADLQKNPNDYALREKIIRHVQTMKPKPAVPDEAQKYMDRGLAAIEGGKGEEDFKAASAEFAKAANLAPWLGDAYRNLAIAQDKSGQYDAALKNLRLYLLTKHGQNHSSIRSSTGKRRRPRNPPAKPRRRLSKMRSKTCSRRSTAGGIRTLLKPVLWS